jgi:hypothetical protein
MVQWRALVTMAMKLFFLKGGEFVDQMSDYQPFKMVSAARGYCRVRYNH